MPLITTTGSSVTITGAITGATDSDPWIVWTQGTQSVSLIPPPLALQEPWPAWNMSITSNTMASTSVTADPWHSWNRVNDFTAAIELGMRRAEAEDANPEIAAARERQRRADYEVRAVRRRQNAAKRQAADERAEKLLVSILSTSQREQYTAERRFTVHLPNGNRYMVRKGRHGNIERIDEQGKRIENLCVHVAPHEIPDCDNMAAQKLMLETNEPELRRIANISRY